MSKKACLGGWCALRDACPHHVAPTNRVNPAERLCDPGHDGYIERRAIRVERSERANETLASQVLQ